MKGSLAVRTRCGVVLGWCLLWPGMLQQPTADTVGTQPPVSTDAGQASLERVPDSPLDAPPSGTVSPRFVVEHRSALNGRLVTVRGMVVSAVAPDTIPPRQGGVIPNPAQNPQPRIRLADADDRDRDVRYDLTVLLPEGHPGHATGERVEVRGTVDGNRRAVLLMSRE